MSFVSHIIILPIKDLASRQTVNNFTENLHNAEVIQGHNTQNINWIMKKFNLSIQPFALTNPNISNKSNTV